MTDNNFDNFINFVQQKIQEYSEITILIKNNEINPQLINKALAEYLNICIQLTGVYKILKYENFEIKKDYQIWYDMKFLESKRKVNNNNESKTKPSLTEYETQLRVDNSIEYNEWQEKLFISEEKVSFYRRILENFKKYDNILTTLATNMRTEMRILNLEDRMNTKDYNINKNKVRTLKKDIENE